MYRVCRPGVNHRFEAFRQLSDRMTHEYAADTQLRRRRYAGEYDRQWEAEREGEQESE